MANTPELPGPLPWSWNDDMGIMCDATGKYIHEEIALAYLNATPAREAQLRDEIERLGKENSERSAYIGDLLEVMERERGRAGGMINDIKAALAQARAEALEEAAKVADDAGGWIENTGSVPTDLDNQGRNAAAKEIADAIRALKDKP